MLYFNVKYIVKECKLKSDTPLFNSNNYGLIAQLVRAHA